MADRKELVVEIAVTEDGSAQAMIFPDPDGYTASSLLLETGKGGQLITVYRITVSVPLPKVVEANVSVEEHAHGVLGVEPFDRWGDTSRATGRATPQQSANQARDGERT